jgi:hypothetical protein
LSCRLTGRGPNSIGEKVWSTYSILFLPALYHVLSTMLALRRA